MKTAADLNGKTVGVTALGDLLSASTLAWIDQNGGTSSTVKLVELPPAGMAAALVAGRIDAASFAEPYLSTAVRAGTVRVFGNIFEAIAPRFLVSGYVGVPDFINANRDLVKRFQRAQLEGNAFANAHPDQTAPWLAEFAKVDLAVVKGSKREVFAESMDPGARASGDQRPREAEANRPRLRRARHDRNGITHEAAQRLGRHGCDARVVRGPADGSPNVAGLCGVDQRGQGGG